MGHPRSADDGRTSSFSLDRVDARIWVIRDLKTPPNDPDHVVACLEEADDVGVDVVWVRTSVPLPTMYLDVESVVEELQRWASRRRSEPPNRIPRIPRISPRSRF